MSAAFAPGVQTGTVATMPVSKTILRVSSTGNDVDTRSFLLTREEINPIFSFGSEEKEKVVNAHGIWSLIVSLITCPIWLLAMSIVHEREDDENRAQYDMTGKIWSKVWLSMTDSYPTVSGNLERLKAGNDAGACLFVANHGSWLDIPVLCTVLEPVFKFISKAELLKVPCIGAQLEGGEHILIDRDDRRSQLKTFKEGMKWLKKGVPLMAFPEGQRSPDGRLMDFKGGLFLMAAKTKVPIVPITISHAHAVMPSIGLFPVQRGAGKLHVHVHDPIHADGKTEDELADLVRASFLSTLPLEQHPKAEPLLSSEDVEAIANEAAETARVSGSGPGSYLDSVPQNPAVSGPGITSFVDKVGQKTAVSETGLGARQAK